MSTARVKPGDVLGAKYKVERILGAGGMGIVVAARHIDLGQRVALKFMLKEAMSDPSHAERFLREAKAAVQLKSAHTARVLDVGRLKNGEPYMVMEYLDGCDLDAEMRTRGPLPPHVAVDYILQASEALAEAHGLGMIHRDVKLKNLFLTATVDGRPLVKVLDFGLAKQLGSHNDVSLTATNAVFGSPQYMSPEQMRSAKDVDTRSDIWSLGVCLYELLTGRVPFDASGVAEICAMVLKDPVPPPSQFVHGLPADLEDVVLRCLEKDANRRFQSVAELAFALQDYAADVGSARRILHVMETAQKVDHPTLVTNSPPVIIDAGPKTMNAWDSGVPTRRTQTLSKSQLFAVLAALLVMGLSGAIMMVAYKRRTQPVTTITAPSDSVVMQGQAPPPEPATDVTAPAASAAAGVAIGASPTPAIASVEVEPPPAQATPPKKAATKPPAAAAAHPSPKPTPATTPTTPAKPKPKNAPGSGAEYM